MSSPKMSAYSYMIEQQCEGIPSEHKQQYLEETQKCLRKTTIPTEVSKIFNQKQSFYGKHLSEERNNQICISKEKVNICSSSSFPNEVINKKVKRININILHTICYINELFYFRCIISVFPRIHKVWNIREWLNKEMTSMKPSHLVLAMRDLFLSQENVKPGQK